MILLMISTSILTFNVIWKGWQDIKWVKDAQDNACILDHGIIPNS